MTAPEISSPLAEMDLPDITIEIAREIPIDFPFPKSKENYTLSLIPPNTMSDEYYLKVCNQSGEIVQKLPCGTLMEPLTFLYHSFQGGRADLEIFGKDAQTGLLFLVDYESDSESLFFEDAIEIPKYTEARWSRFMTSESNDASMENIIYQINLDTKQPEEIRTWNLQKENGNITLWDCQKNQLIYEGQAALDSEGNLLNEEYYLYLLWDYYYRPNDYSEDFTVYVPFTDEYENTEAFLRECGFTDNQLMYQYYDNYHTLQLELYLDKATGQGCGIVRPDYYDAFHGFIVNSIEETAWEEIDPYDFDAIAGTSYIKETEELEEIIEYTPDGKVDYYKAQGFVGWLRDDDEKRKEPKDTIIEINYIYRDDGTLYYKEYFHDPVIFETSFHTMSTYYDEAGRILYEHAYITHGCYDYYYIYEDETNKPAYCLLLDNDLGAYRLEEMMHFQ